MFTVVDRNNKRKHLMVLLNNGKSLKMIKNQDSKNLEFEKNNKLDDADKQSTITQFAFDSEHRKVHLKVIKS